MIDDHRWQRFSGERPYRLVSIHDVMPSTLASVQDLIDLCQRSGIGRVTLLVVPGHDWTDADLRTLRSFAAQGHELAGHGWNHQCQQIRGFKHRLHSWLLSRNVAEHLTLRESGILELMRKCHRWFIEHQLAPPTLYVPPAWALGTIAPRALRETPFELVETLTGLYWTGSGQRRVLPLAGFEADSVVRRVSLVAFNQINRALANRKGQPLRIAIHPSDHQLLMADQLRAVLQQPTRSLLYRDLHAIGREPPERLARPTRIRCSASE